MFRKLAVSLAVAGVLGAAQAHALGLGKIRIKSALNQPLDAEIQLTQVRDLDPTQIKPKMADTDQFAMAGIDRSRLLSDVQFSVDVSPNGTGTIHLRSHEPVREPFLNLLVEVNWPNGRLVREYTLLLDPPVFNAEPAGGVSQPRVARTTPIAPAPRRETMSAAPSSPARPSGPVNNIRTNAVSGQQVYVEVNDTLGGIAKRYMPGGATLNQMMLALQRKNPNAFPRNNINGLRAGVVLNLPNRDEVRRIGAAEASREVARQMQAWRSGSMPTDAPQQNGSKKKPVAPAESSPAAANAPQGQLKIVTAQDKADDKTKDPTGASQVAENPGPDQEKADLIKRNEALQNQLAVTQESVDKIQRDNTELNDKLTAISQQLETLQRLLELKDQQMAALQNQLKKVQAAPPAPAKPPAPPATLVDKVLASPAYMAAIGALVGALLVALLGMLRRRGNSGSEPYGSRLVEKEEKEEKDTGSGSSGIAGLGAAAAAGAVAGALLAEEQEDEPVQESPTETARENEALAAVDSHHPGDLDLDMDLDLDLGLDDNLEQLDAEEPAPAGKAADKDDEYLIQPEDDEFDLSLDTDFEEEPLPRDQVADADDENFDESLDDILGVGLGDEAEAERSDLRSGMGQLDDVDETFEEPEDTLESLGLDDFINASSLEDEPIETLKGLELEEKEKDLTENEEEAALAFRLNQVAPILPEDDELLDRSAVQSSDSEAQPEAIDAREPATPEEPAAAVEDEVDTDAPMAVEPAGVEWPTDIDEAGSGASSLEAEAPTMLRDVALNSEGDDAEEPSTAAPTFEFEDKAEADEVGADEFDQALSGTVADDEISNESLGTDLELEGDDVPGSDSEAESEPESAVASNLAPAGESQDEPEADIETDEGLELHPELEALLKGQSDESQDDAISLEEDEHADDDLDSMLAALSTNFGGESEDVNAVEDELTSNIAHDLDDSMDDKADLDSELEALLGSVDDEIALDENDADEEDRALGGGLEFLEGTDEVETKLDLARAYIDMEDQEGARDILSEILQEGSDTQQTEARKLMESLT